MIFSLIFSGFCAIASAQQFANWRNRVETMGLSAGCVQALNTTVQCHDALADFEPTFSIGLAAKVMDKRSLDAVCVDGCRSSLLDLRAKALSACSPNDKMRHNGYSFPPTYLIDMYLFMFDSSCYKEKTTGAFCDIKLVEWSQTPNITRDCEDCALGPMRIQLQNGISFSNETERTFKSLTSSCKATGYGYTLPPLPYETPDKPSSTNPGTPTTSATQYPCPTTYTVAAGDTCDSISKAKNVSTFGLIETNGLMMPCRLPAPGKSMCLPLSCKLHLLESGETCLTLMEKYGVNRAQLVSWNEMLDYQCLNIRRWEDTYLCVGDIDNRSPTTTAQPTAVPAPTNAAPKSNKRCLSWHTVTSGEYCAKLANDNSITLDDFFFLNPDLDSGCTKLQLGMSYCVKPVGDITTYPGYPSQQPSTIFTRPTTSYPVPVETLLPRAPGTDANCLKYRNWFDISRIVELYLYHPSLDTINLCLTVTSRNRITLADFLTWNPSLDKDKTKCMLAKGYSYCVQKEPSDETTSSTIPSSSPTTSMPPSTTTTPTGPSPTQDGIIKGCNKFYKAASGDTCQGIVDKHYPISLTDFYRWNPAVKNDCSGLWQGYYYCVGMPVDFRLKTWYHADCSGAVYNDVRVENGSDGLCINTDCQVGSITTDAEGLCPDGQVQISYWEKPGCQGQWYGYGYGSKGACRKLWTSGYKFKSLHLRCAKEQDDCVSQKTCTYDPEPSANIC